MTSGPPIKGPIGGKRSGSWVGGAGWGWGGEMHARGISKNPGLVNIQVWGGRDSVAFIRNFTWRKLAFSGKERGENIFLYPRIRVLQKVFLCI